MKTLNKKIFILISCVFFYSCKNDSFKLPTEYTCLKYNESDSIVENYSLLNKKIDNNFKTMFGFELYKPNETNLNRLKEKTNFGNKIKVSEKTIPFSVSFNQLNDTTISVLFEVENIHKELFKTNSLKQKKYQDKLNIENSKNDKFESVETTFQNLFENLKLKYGKYSFYENNSMTQDILNKFDSDNSYEYIRYFWIHNDILITLKHEIFHKDDFENNDNELRVKIDKEYVVLVYESISLRKKMKEIVNEEWKESARKEIEKNERIERRKDSINQIEKNKLLNEL